ncbi:MAG: VacJ family lipoprotein, partial [Glaciimonas sp.]|nr:VacJ family lipoprotein [Glaciimonas sp.]
ADKRANLLDASSLVEEAALDKYEFIRDAYTQRRQSQITGPMKDDDAEDRPSKASADE